MEKYYKNTIVKIHFGNKTSKPRELDLAIRSLYAMEYIKFIPNAYYKEIGVGLNKRYILDYDKIIEDFDNLVDGKCRLEVVKQVRG